MEVGVPFLLVVLQVVCSIGSAPTGRGGVGSSVCWWRGGEGGGPGRCCVGGKVGGARELLLWLCSFSESRFRRAAADYSCSRLHLVVVASPRRMVVRRRRRRLGARERGGGSDRGSFRALRGLCAFCRGLFVISFLCWTCL